MNKENKLGMGLGALLSQSSNNKAIKESSLKINISQIKPNPSQPRKNFSEQELNDLATSIKNQGLLQPIIVRSTNEDQFEIIAGERRWRASQIAGLHEVDCVIKNIKDADILESALIENIQRDMAVLTDKVNLITGKLERAEGRWEMAENLHEVLANIVNEMEWDIKDFNREINY